MKTTEPARHDYHGPLKPRHPVLRTWKKMRYRLLALVVWGAIVKGSYKPVERILLLLSTIYFAYPVSAFLAKPDWKLAIASTVIPQLNSDPNYLIMIVGLIGTTITPWMQFYLQA